MGNTIFFILIVDLDNNFGPYKYVSNYYRTKKGGGRNLPFFLGVGLMSGMEEEFLVSSRIRNPRFQIVNPRITVPFHPVVNEFAPFRLSELAFIDEYHRSIIRVDLFCKIFDEFFDSMNFE